jgi:hypothetical protein
MGTATSRSLSGLWECLETNRAAETICDLRHALSD